MMAEIYDNKGNLLRVIEGSFADNVITYKENQMKFLFLKFGGETKTIACNYDAVEKRGNTKVARYEFDGKNYHQVTWRRIATETSGDYYVHVRQGIIEGDALMQKPFDTVDAIKILGYVFLIIMMIAVIYETQQLQGIANGLGRPLDNQSKILAGTLPAMINITQQNYATNNALLHYLETH